MEERRDGYLLTDDTSLMDMALIHRWLSLLATRDAHALYRRAGFHELNRPERWLEIDPTTEATI